MSLTLSPVSAYVADSKNETTRVAQFQAYDPATKSGIAYLQKQAPKLTSPDALLKDYRSLQVVLGAFGMSSHTNDTALLRQLMTQDPNSASSLAKRSANPLFQRFAQFMSNWSPSPFSNAANVRTIATQYATNNFEQSEGKATPGLQQALYFRRTIGSVKSLQQLMSDPTLLEVAVTASGLPSEFGLLSYNQQVATLTKRINLSDFKTPSGIDQLAERYLALSQVNSMNGTQQFTATSTTTVDPALAILTGDAGSGSQDPLLSLYA